jgi:hypothetical protein
LTANVDILRGAGSGAVCARPGTDWTTIPQHRARASKRSERIGWSLLNHSLQLLLARQPDQGAMPDLSMPKVGTVLHTPPP